MQNGDINLSLLLTDTQIWRCPHLIQAARRGELLWDEFLQRLVHDLAFGMSPQNWLGRLKEEGNFALLDELAAQMSTHSSLVLYSRQDEDEWQQLVQLASDELTTCIANNDADVTEEDRLAYQEVLEFADQNVRNREYGDAVSFLEYGHAALRSSIEQRQAAAAVAFDSADDQVKHVRAKFALLHASRFPGGEVRHRQARNLLLQADDHLLARDYTSAVKFSGWVQDIIDGNDVPGEAQQFLNETGLLLSVSSHSPEIVPIIEPIATPTEQMPLSARTWTRAEDEYLVDNYDVLDDQQLKQRFNADEATIAQRIQFHGLIHDRKTGRKAQWPNPYVAGKPLRSKTVFVGREDVFSFVADNLSGAGRDQDRNLLVLLGHRRTGKTSILLQLRRNRREILNPRVPIFIDMEGLLPFPGGLKNFFWKLAIRVREEIQDQESIQLPEPIEDEYKDPSFAFQLYLNKAIGALDGRGLVIMLDEFHAIEPGQSVLDINVYKMLRSVMQHNVDADFILAGTMQMEALMRNYQAAMFGSALTKRIDFLEDQDARKLIMRPVQNFVQYSQEAVDLIVDVTASHPYFVQLVCHTLMRYQIERGKSKVYADDVERILPLTLERGVHFDEIWATDTTELERYIMAVVGEMAPNRSLWCKVSKVAERLRNENQMPKNPEDLDEAMRNLTHRRILRRNDDGNSVQFQVFVFGSWVTTNKPFEVVRRDIRAEEAAMRRRIERQPMSA